jgi:anti-sigma factor RsiW
MASDRERGTHVQVLLGAYILGGLSAAEGAAVRDHLDRCALCRAEYDELACVPGWLDLLAEPEAGLN